VQKKEFTRLSKVVPKAKRKLDEAIILIEEMPDSAAGAARACAELLLKYIATHHANGVRKHESMNDLIKRLRHAKLISRRCADNFHDLRMASNPAIHADITITSEDARAIVERLIQLVRWFEGAILCANDHFDLPTKWDWSPSNEEEARMFSCIERGDIAAINALGELDEANGDIPSAVRWYLMAANKKHRAGHDSFLRLCAGAGDCHSMNEIGHVLLSEGNILEAWDWYRMAGDAGNADALFSLGLLRDDHAELLPEDDVTAQEWYLRAAHEGDHRAMLKLAELNDDWYRNVRDGDMDEAIDWYIKAANLGNDDAMYRLAEMYEKGQRLPQDDKSAVRWYQEAANRGNVYAKRRLIIPWRLPQERRIGFDERYLGEVN
jgi:TPR repeat protein